MVVENKKNMQKTEFHIRFFTLSCNTNTLNIRPLIPDMRFSDEDKEPVLTYLFPLKKQKKTLEYFILDLSDVEHFHNESVLNLLFEIIRLYRGLIGHSICLYKTIPPKNKIPREVFNLLGLDHCLEFTPFQG
jgi:hypothetical protein